MPFVGYWQTVAVQQQNGADNTSGAAASALHTTGKNGTFAAGFWSQLGQCLWIKAAGKMSSVITTPGTMRFDVRLGATVVFDSLAVLLDTAAAHANVGWILEIMLTLTTVGSAATFMGHGSLICESIKGQGTAMPVGGVVANLPWNSTPANGNTVDLTASQALDLFFTQTVNTGHMICQQFWAGVN